MYCVPRIRVRDFMDEQMELAARIVVRYSQGKMADEVVIEFMDKDGNTKALKVSPLPPEQLPGE